MSAAVPTPSRLLVVDDEPDLLTLYELTLRKSGHQVAAASDLAQARALLAAQRFDALITDMRLPDGLGLELVHELAQAGRPEKTIVVTAYGSASNAVEALKAGAFDYLTKPVAPAQLRAAVANALQAARSPCSVAQTNPATSTAPRAGLGRGEESERVTDEPRRSAVTAPVAGAGLGRGEESERVTDEPWRRAVTAPTAGAGLGRGEESERVTDEPRRRAVTAPVAGAGLGRGEESERVTDEPRPGPAPAAAAATAPAPALQQLVGRSPAMQALRERVLRVARSMAPVLVLGESGTGKELVARALHQCSHRCDGPFVAVNCGAIPDTLLEAEFFGVRKGAYTGASAHREGYFQAARGGTLFLDEIGDLPQPMQVKLLRAVQERRVRSLGATDDEATDVRLVSATHLDLERAVAAGRFRQDLYYRLNVIDLHLPPLRERLDDLPELAQALLQRLSERNGNPKPPTLSPAALARLAQHPFPGNVRELENLLERALALHPGPVLDAEAVWTPPPAAPRAGTEANQGHTADFSPTQRPAGGWPADAPDEQAPTREQLLAWLNLHRWNQSRAARQLGWTLAKLRYWMQRHGLSDATSQS
ncbi:sigma-54-dependent transcriptional regulator [Serpentinimonas barnesii]|uniref:sigma-54-dependent transcriptional regulator n=1 Tax=Serpentinimonas barnesii TaxID=1458427 RepID=UPI0005ED60FF|nr:sigma-54 dependent transcriptional regulator [Serpentinimonas barnesii]